MVSIPMVSAAAVAAAAVVPIQVEAVKDAAARTFGSIAAQRADIKVVWSSEALEDLRPLSNELKRGILTEAFDGLDLEANPADPDRGSIGDVQWRRVSVNVHSEVSTTPQTSEPEKGNDGVSESYVIFYRSLTPAEVGQYGYDGFAILRIITNKELAAYRGKADELRSIELLA
jgi:hypothetical protein